MKLIDIVNIIESLTIMSKLTLSAKDSFNLSNIIITFQNEVILYDETKTKLCQKYGETEDGITYKVDEQNQPRFFKELYELDNIEIDNIEINKVQVPLSKIDELANKIGGIEPRHLINARKVIEIIDDTVLT